jgi:co-chaperonin GroES (HSP10)
MPHADTQIFAPVGHVEPFPNLVAIASKFFCLTNRVAVLMDPVPETFAWSTILVPQGEDAGKFRPDSGTVVSSAHPDLKMGDRVLVKPYDGLWLTQRDCGVIFPERHSPAYKATQDRITTKRAVWPKATESGLLIPDNAHDEKPQQGLVYSVGPECKQIAERDKILYSKYGGQDVEGYLVMSETMVYAVLYDNLFIPEGRELRFYKGMGDIVGRIEG